MSPFRLIDHFRSWISRRFQRRKPSTEPGGARTGEVHATRQQTASAQRNPTRTYPVYLRAVLGKVKKLMSDPLTANHWANEYFDLQTTEHSVYRADNEFQEAQAVAAHLLTVRSRNNIESMVAIRIYNDDISQCGLSLSLPGTVPGETGYAPVDARHFDLRGNQECAKRLIELIVEDFSAGGDRIRHVGAYQLYRALKGFCNNETNLAPKALDRCKALTDHYEVTILKLDKP